MKQIICLGDGGLNEKNPLLDLYIIAQSKKPIPNVMLLPTASGDNINLIKHFYQTFSRYPCVPSYLSLFSPSTKDLEDYILSKDIVYVSGGQTKSMLALWREWGVDAILRKAHDQGVILAGGSAGSVCWFEQCITDSIPGELSVMNCLGLLEGSNCPHFTSDERREAYSKFLISKEIKPGYANDDCAALHFIDNKLFRSVSAYEEVKTYNASEGGFKSLETIYLGTEENQTKYLWESVPFQRSLTEEHSEEVSTETQKEPTS
jgi:dipeptidase E